MLVDSHCHLDYESLSDDLDGVVERAGRAGIGTMLTISTRLDRFSGVLAIAEQYEHIWCTVGVHPHEAGAEPDLTTDKLIELSAHPKVIGIGETGLDYYYEHRPREIQEQSFRAHIGAARETGLPVIVHSRNADGDTARVLTAEYATGAFPGLLHCFSSTKQLAEIALEIEFRISFSGIVTFKNAHEVRETVEIVPMNRLLVETDSPYLAPVPNRGKTNEPSFVVHTAAEVADLKGVSSAEVADVTTQNFFNLFTKATPPDAKPGSNVG